MQKEVLIQKETLTQKESPKSQGPKAKFNIGAVQVAVWENEGTQGKVFPSVSIVKRYKNGEEWKNTNSFKASEIPQAILALQKAYEHISLKES